MSDIVNIQKRVEDLKVSPEQTGYSKVIMIIGVDNDGNQLIYEAGDDSGKTLYVTNPFGTQQMANDVLERVRGFQYQPFEAKDAIYDPAVEMSDGVSINGMYSGIYARAIKLGDFFSADISAPHDEEIEAEQGLETATDRQFTRFLSQTKAGISLTSQEILAEVTRATEAEEALSATLSVQATQIAAKVSKTGGSNNSFGWMLDDSSWTIYSNGNQILRATQSGLEVKGKISADSGYIGGANGFTITSNKLYNNISSMQGTQNQGVYIGTDGIKLGQGFSVSSTGAVTASNLTIRGGSISIGQNFSVNSSGNVNATNINLSGTLTIGGKQITAANLYNGASQAASNYGNWNGTTSTVNSNGGNWTTGYNYAYGNSTSYAKATTRGSSCPEYFHATAIAAMSDLIADNALYVGGWSDDKQASWQSKTVITNVTLSVDDSVLVRDYYGNTKLITNVSGLNKTTSTIRYLGKG